ncbi:hypothetical protein [Streptomyces galbus]|uniref:Uncharacterized protein n=1 Tax=Streptomyces galbus TaxID=33898 RepID=A0ABX1INR3_STRGB|nr:hypothetical protein [Streptomyces galbus]NKQ26001.1 hypothetical protein [Streptomyces galbus]
MALLAALVPIVMLAVVLALGRYEDALLPTSDTEQEPATTGLTATEGAGPGATA